MFPPLSRTKWQQVTNAQIDAIGICNRRRQELMNVDARPLIWSVMVVLVAGLPVFGQPAPEEAFLEGSKLPYFGSVHPWNRRFFYDHTEGEDFLPGRIGQREMLDIVENRPKEAVAYCQQRLEIDPRDLESLFNLTVAWCELNDTPQALAAMKRALVAGLPFERFLAGPRDLLEPLTKTAEFRRLASQRKIQLLHGPMLGCLTDRSARFWVRTAGEVPVRVLVSTSKDLARPIKSATVASNAESDYTAIAKVDGLNSDTRYYYDVLVNGKPTLGPTYPSFRTYVARGKKSQFDVAFGGGAGFNPHHERMWNTIASHDLSAFLFLGDNVYIDLPGQPNGLHYYTYYRRQSRPEYRRFVASTAMYAIWDDHDCAMDDLFFGPYVDKPSWKPAAWRLFRNNWNNPRYGDGEEQPGCWFEFSIGDVDFFLLDGRYYRTNPYVKQPSMLGPQQKAWLKKAVAGSRATFKVLASPVPWAFDAKGDSLDTWNGYRDERKELFDFLADEKIEGIVLISADRHRSDARLIDRKGAYPLYEFESSRLTNKKFAEPKGKALFSYHQKCSFGKLTFDTTKPDPEVTYQIVNIDDETMHSLTVKKSQLSH
jgi:alkaline phosphatase D